MSSLQMSGFEPQQVPQTAQPTKGEVLKQVAREPVSLAQDADGFNRLPKDKGEQRMGRAATAARPT